MKYIAAAVVAVFAIEAMFSPIRDIILAWKYGRNADADTSLFGDKKNDGGGAA